MIAALTELARSVQTRANFGLHYEPTRLSLAQQTLIEELREILTDYEAGDHGIDCTNLRDGHALKALVFVLRLALDRSSGRPLSRGFLEFLQAEFPQNPGNLHTRIVMPQKAMRSAKKRKT